MALETTPMIDPVCGMTVDPLGLHKHEYEGAVYHFCSERCLARFEVDPAPFVTEKDGQRENAVAESGGRWTCPMHPEVMRDEPGACPICGMALESLEIGEHDENPELADMLHRFWGSLILTVPVFAIAMGEMVPGNPLSKNFTSQTLAWTQLALGTPVVFLGRLAVPNTWSGLYPNTTSQHVHANCDRDWRRLAL